MSYLLLGISLYYNFLTARHAPAIDFNTALLNYFSYLFYVSLSC